MATRFGNSGEGGRTPNQTPQHELGDGSGPTEAELIDQIYSPACLGLRKLRGELNYSLNDIQRTYSLNDIQGTKGTAKLETMIQEAFEYIRQLERGGDISQPPVAGLTLAGLVVEIAIELEKAVGEILSESSWGESKRVSLNYGAKIGYLNELIPYIVKLILKVGPNDSKFRGREPVKKYIEHPNNALLTALDEAAYALVDQAAAAAKAEGLNNRQGLINTISSLLEMTQELMPDELEKIYDKILSQIFVMIQELVKKSGNIDKNDKLIEQVTSWYINYFAKHEDTFDQFVNQLLNRIPPHLELKKILSGKLAELDPKHWDMASRLNIDTRLEKRIAGLEEENAGLEERIAGLEMMVQRLLEQAGIQTDEEK